MCLDVQCEIPQRFKKEHGEYVGWKLYSRLFEYDNEKFALIPEWTGRPQKIGMWLNEVAHRNSTEIVNKENRLCDGTGHTYRKGFHVYLNKPTDRGIKRKVYFRHVVAYGLQNRYTKDSTCVVVKNIKILKTRRTKPNVRPKSKKRISKK